MSKILNSGLAVLSFVLAGLLVHDWYTGVVPHFSTYLLAILCCVNVGLDALCDAIGVSK